MAELKARDGELTTADLSNCGISPGLPDGLELVKRHEPETPEMAAVALGPRPLFSESETGDILLEWKNLQTGFANEPRRTVEAADKLIAAVMQRLAENFAIERSGLVTQWDRGETVSDEELRVAQQRYCSFFTRLLKS